MTAKLDLEIEHVVTARELTLAVINQKLLPPWKGQEELINLICGVYQTIYRAVSKAE